MFGVGNVKRVVKLVVLFISKSIIRMMRMMKRVIIRRAGLNIQPGRGQCFLHIAASHAKAETTTGDNAKGRWEGMAPPENGANPTTVNLIKKISDTSYV